ncbi:MAG: pyruvate kinase [Flavisolibacter sp.]|nr:pyruvate kinase [Flavisolibacter sp.]
MIEPQVTEQLKSELVQLDAIMLKAEQDFKPLLSKVHPSQYQSACNLLHYLTLRSKDIRGLQDTLHQYGFSSLASSESHIRSQVLAILNHLDSDNNKEAAITYKSSKELLKKRSMDLFGPCSNPGIPSIMITFDSTYADDYPEVKNLLQSGMSVARINCAHDNESIWRRMIEHVKKASTVTGLPYKIYMDLPGPKIRTYLPPKKKKKAQIKVQEGQTISLAEKDAALARKGIIGCTLPGIITQLKKGERVLIDDGMIEAKVADIHNDSVQLQILRMSGKKPFIRSEKGLNFPDTQLSIPALTDYDLKCLPFILEHADMVGYSFVRNANDLLQLQGAMEPKKLPIIIKIETPEAVKNLPQLLLQGMREELFGVMIARGDLAVEIGFERMSEIQEEILWICEAGHVPVIWATQVLENLNKSGIATRSEVTDAAHAVMAECVLVNKGSHTIEVIEALRDILYRSGGHHVKKRYTFRPLQIASRFMAG